MTLEFETPEQLYAHYQEVAHRLSSRRYVYPINPVVTSIAPRPRLQLMSETQLKIEAVPSIPSPEDYWLKLIGENLPLSKSAGERMLHYVAQKHGITYAEIVGASRKSKIVSARQEAYWWLNRQFGFSTLKTAQLIGGRDHTCVVQGVPKHLERVRKAEIKAAQ